MEGEDGERTGERQDGEKDEKKPRRAGDWNVVDEGRRGAEIECDGNAGGDEEEKVSYDRANGEDEGLGDDEGVSKGEEDRKQNGRKGKAETEVTEAEKKEEEMSEEATNGGAYGHDDGSGLDGFYSFGGGSCA